MRIIVGNDYYDKALQYGADSSIILVREREHFLADKDVYGIYAKSFRARFVATDNKNSLYLTSNENSLRVKTDESPYQKDWCFKPVGVVIGGKHYSGVKASNHFSIEDKSDICFWNYDSLVQWLSSKGVALKNKHRIPGLYNSNTLDEEYFNIVDVIKTGIDWLIEKHISILTYNIAGSDVENSYNLLYKTPWRVNGDNLKSAQFIKVMDPVTAYQELSMWVGGVLPASSAPMIEITDKDRIHKHGFDKFSFRKSKENAK